LLAILGDRSISLTISVATDLEGGDADGTIVCPNTGVEPVHRNAPISVNKIDLYII
jgi:hypothetical protein